MDRNTRKRLEGTRACDDAGRPLILHHGTFADFDSFSRTEDIGYHFGTLSQARRRMTEARRQHKVRDGRWRVVDVALTVRSPLVLQYDPRIWDHWLSIREICELADRRWLDDLRDEGINTPKAALSRIRDRLLENGWDSILYRNMHEANVGANLEWSWVALRADDVIMLGEDGPGGVLDMATGSPITGLPRRPRDIPGTCNRNGTVRYRHDRIGFAEAVRTHMAAKGVAPRRDETDGWLPRLSFAWPVDGALLDLDAQIDLGRIVVTDTSGTLDPSSVIDDKPHRGLLRGGQNDNRTRLVFERIPGQDMNSFLAKVDDVVHRLVSAPQLEPAP